MSHKVIFCRNSYQFNSWSSETDLNKIEEHLRWAYLNRTFTDDVYWCSVMDNNGNETRYKMIDGVFTETMYIDCNGNVERFIA